VKQEIKSYQYPNNNNRASFCCLELCVLKEATYFFVKRPSRDKRLHLMWQSELNINIIIGADTNVATFLETRCLFHMNLIKIESLA
jgi:hypothetical protein